MGLRRTWNCLQALLYIGTATLILGSAGVFVWYLITHGTLDWVRLYVAFLGTFFLAIPLIVSVILVSSGGALMLRDNMFKAAAHNDPNITPVAAVQPDQALALHHGEVLSLNSSPKSTRTIKSVASSALGLVIFTLIGMSLPVALLPAFNPLQWLEAEAATPSLTDWMAFFYPLVLVLIFVCSGFASAISGKAKYIVADDDGVSVVRTRGRRRFIPWHDILVFLHPLTGSGEPPTGGYFLWGREHGLIVSIPNRKKTQTSLTGAFTLPEQEIGPFIADAHRLLATIIARSYIPLRVYTRSAMWIAWVQRRAPATTLDLDDALAAPVANIPLQPSADAVAAAGRDLAVKLRSRLPVVPTVLEAFVWLIGLLLVAAVYVLTQPVPVSFEAALAGDLLSLVTIVVLFTFCLILAVLLSITHRLDSAPPVSVDKLGITGKIIGKKTTAIPWTEVHAWLVVPPTPGTRKPYRYLMFTTRGKLLWKEPQGALLGGRGVRGDRQQAYTERAAHLHAFIVSQTGFPLREYIGTVAG